MRTPTPRRPSLSILLCAAGALIALAAPAAAQGPCERAASDALSSCLASVASAQRECYLGRGLACEPEQLSIRAPLSTLELAVRASCGATHPDPDALVDRLAGACAGEPAASASRVFGGPQGAVLPALDSPARECLLEADRVGSGILQYAFDLERECVLDDGGCDAAAVGIELAAAESAARRILSDACGGRLERRTGIEPATLVRRSVDQAGCLVATAHDDTAPLAPGCGPRPEVVVPPRATPTQIVLDEETWGTRCGDGSPYAFQVRLAPEGQPVENVVIDLQGGGVCYFDRDCAGVSDGLLRALDNDLPTGGILSSTDADNPFRDWTKVFLPYCTQDLHIGGGGTSDFPSRTVHRFGGLNVRAALAWLRDALWTEMDAEGAAGYRPERLRVILSGGSAGGFGVVYHYHHVLDELRWRNTVAIPDAAMGLSNGRLYGITGLGFLFQFERGVLGWRAKSLMPSYCSDVRCAAIPVIERAHSERLGDVPMQQILNLSNQVDDVQVGTTLFESRAEWLTKVRESYCEQQGIPGLHYFLPARTGSIHTVLGNGAYFPDGFASAGQELGDWVRTAVEDPEALVDRVEEGTLAVGGVPPFACPVD